MLHARTGQVAERLDSRTIKRTFTNRPFVAGWRFPVKFPDGNTRRLDMVATAHFPSIPVRTALVDRPEFLTWPHVERDGILCLLPNMAEFDPDDPCAVAENLLHRSVSVIEQLLEGSIVEQVFCEEFLTYWAYEAHEDGSKFFSLIEPAPPSRVVYLWTGNGIEVVGEDAESLKTWVLRRFGPNADTTMRKAAFVWLPSPPLPSEYPEKSADLFELVATTGKEAIDTISQVTIGKPQNVVTILGAEGRGGPGLVAVRAPNPSRLPSFPGSTKNPLSKGFRPGRMPDSVLVRRFFGTAPVVRGGIQRADHNWVHGRGRDLRSKKLRDCTVVIAGCGSIGGPIACTLAQTGTGKLILVDHDDLSWANVGRHPLGAPAVGCKKAKALAQQLQSRFPHLEISSRESNLETLVHSNAELLAEADLIVAATANWGAESMLNRWHVSNGRSMPVLYCWTEPHAVAGHAVVIAPEGGCFQCHIGRTGSPSFNVVEWQDGSKAKQEEPACGAHYTPYGPIELGYVTTMISEVAMECLLDPPDTSFSRVYATSEQRIKECGGQWTADWSAEQGGAETGLQMIDRPWSSTDCAVCINERF